MLLYVNEFRTAGFASLSINIAVPTLSRGATELNETLLLLGPVPRAVRYAGLNFVVCIEQMTKRFCGYIWESDGCQYLFLLKSVCFAAKLTCNLQ